MASILICITRFFVLPFEDLLIFNLATMSKSSSPKSQIFFDITDLEKLRKDIEELERLQKEMERIKKELEDKKSDFKSGFTRLIEQEGKKKELEAKKKKTDKDNADIEKFKKDIDAILAQLRAIQGYAVKNKWYKTLDSYEVCKDGQCTPSAPDTNNKVKCEDVKEKPCKGKCACRMFVSINSGSEPLFDANEVLPNSDFPRFYRSEYYSLSCHCVK
jgi:superfamily II RNA helicase